MTIPMLIRFSSLEEKKKIEKLAARAKLSLANYVRSRLDLEPLSHGGPRAYPKRTPQETAKLLREVAEKVLREIEENEKPE